MQPDLFLSSLFHFTCNVLSCKESCFSCLPCEAAFSFILRIKVKQPTRKHTHTQYGDKADTHAKRLVAQAQNTFTGLGDFQIKRKELRLHKTCLRAMFQPALH